jgi:hypothetical protein
MKIRILVSLGGANFVLSPGDITERFDAKGAQDLIAAGYAERVDTVERAVVAPAPEKRGKQ